MKLKPSSHDPNRSQRQHTPPFCHVRPVMAIALPLTENPAGSSTPVDVADPGQVPHPPRGGRRIEERLVDRAGRGSTVTLTPYGCRAVESCRVLASRGVSGDDMCSAPQGGAGWKCGQCDTQLSAGHRRQYEVA